MSALGIGVTDTSSLWAAGSLVYQPEKQGFRATSPPDLSLHPIRELYATNEWYFLSLLHNLLLYDELRTDIDVLSSEEAWYHEPVRKLLKHLSSAVRIDSIPGAFTDDQVMEAIAPAFIEKTKSELNSDRPS